MRDTQMAQPGHTVKSSHQGTNGELRLGRQNFLRLLKEVRCAVRRSISTHHGTGCKSRKGMKPVGIHFRIKISFKI